MKKALPFILVALVLAVASMFLPVEKPPTSLSAETLVHIGPLNLTNSMLTAWICTIIIAVFFFMATSKMQLKPSGSQNFVEFLVESIYNLTESVSGPRDVSKFFVIPTTIFIFVLVTNFFGLLIGVPLVSLGLCRDEHHTEEVEAIQEAAPPAERERTGGWSTCGPDQHIIPFFRAPAADLNFTFSLAIITQVAAWTFGFMALGFGGYMSKFFIFEGFKKAKSGMDYALGAIDFLVGLIELLSEFVKIIAYTFRLFGNIFAGEVMLVVIMFLVPLFIVTPLIGFEIFVNFIQAFVFYILSVAFYTIAVKPHGGHEEEAH
ncbi:MAG TPA: FoF1 ATP synthase subunit a [Anaerolineae bacterium]|nr:F0F1 ATP synthase subunit A [Anaerolineae bacterium]MCB0181491.1 F0F1 ATP synthase subunit A [Anaerolineae bacterium]MCB9102968.1 F0F1 ATP synthase subunit A [Anaerolineales bacterium]HRV92965.1 FoF1 ATP synthase subunit a [Anaerolineae bacterium]